MFKPMRALKLMLVLTVLLIVGVASAQKAPYAPVIDPANFVKTVNNPYFPLPVGMTYVYEAETDEGMERIEVTVLPQTRVVMGIDCVIVRDSVWLEGELIEDTFDWYAQDKDGNVWYMGEDTAEYEGGVAINHNGAWESGVDGALPGIIMYANPQPGDPYRQEYYAGQAEDMAQIMEIGQTASTPYGDFTDVLVIKEWNPLDVEGGEALKYYAPGIGFIFETKLNKEGENKAGEVEIAETLVDVLDYTDMGENADEDGVGKDGVDDVEDSDSEGDDEDSDNMTAPSGTPLISEQRALEIAQTVLTSVEGAEIELELEGGIWLYSIESDTQEVEIDAITGTILSPETE